MSASCATYHIGALFHAGADTAVGQGGLNEPKKIGGREGA